MKKIFICILAIFLCLVSGSELRKKSRAQCTSSKGNFINWGRNQPLSLVDTGNGIYYSELRIDSQTDWQDWQTWCLERSYMGYRLISPYNGLCVQVEQYGSGLYAYASYECNTYFKRVVSPKNSLYFSYGLDINGQTYYLTAAEAGDDSLYMEVLETGTSNAQQRKRRFQEWNFHLP